MAGPLASYLKIEMQTVPVKYCTTFDSYELQLTVLYYG
jgi:hypothetical protein